MYTRIIKNIIKCKACGDIIESVFRHSLKSCSCGKVSVYGGRISLKRFGDLELVEEMSITEEVV
ncbi:hypothetical protein KAR91_15515 [Candidatus Pacearchaeota archaeon]|nr:hypothetical protein [Candidatus Pacearchaeota archaeon]